MPTQPPLPAGLPLKSFEGDATSGIMVHFLPGSSHLTLLKESIKMQLNGNLPEQLEWLSGQGCQAVGSIFQPAVTTFVLIQGDGVTYCIPQKYFDEPSQASLRKKIESIQPSNR